MLLCGLLEISSKEIVEKCNETKSKKNQSAIMAKTIRVKDEFQLSSNLPMKEMIRTESHEIEESTNYYNVDFLLVYYCTINVFLSAA